MNRVIIVLTILLGLSFAQQKQFVIQKQITSDTESDKNVNVQMNDDEITIKLNVDGEEQVFKANPKNEDEMKALEEMLAEKDVNLDLLHMDDDHRVWETMLTSGGYLGVKIDDITDQLRNYFNVKGDGGVLITEVMDDSPAEKSGLKAGDVIIKVNDQWIGDREELQETIRSFEPEEKVTVTTVRKGREKALSVVLGESETPQFAFRQMGNDKFICDIPGVPMPGKNHMKWFMFDGDDEDMDHHMDFNSDFDKLKEEMESLKKDFKKLQQEMQSLRSK